MSDLSNYINSHRIRGYSSGSSGMASSTADSSDGNSSSNDDSICVRTYLGGKLINTEYENPYSSPFDKMRAEQDNGSILGFSNPPNGLPPMSTEDKIRWAAYSNDDGDSSESFRPYGSSDSGSSQTLPVLFPSVGNSGGMDLPPEERNEADELEREFRSSGSMTPDKATSLKAYLTAQSELGLNSPLQNFPGGKDNSVDLGSQLGYSGSDNGVGNVKNYIEHSKSPGQDESADTGDIPWYQKLDNDFTDKNEDYLSKFSRGDIGGGLINLLGTTLGTPKSLYLNAINDLTGLVNGEKPKFIYNMDFHDYSDENKRKFGGESMSDIENNLRAKGTAGSIAAGILGTGSELISDPTVAFSLAKAAVSADALKGGEYAEGAVPETAEADTANPVKEATEGAGDALKPQEFMDELAKSGVKYSPNDVVTVAKTPDGKLMWLENGSSSSGLQHIVDGHAADFANRGIDDIPSFINRTLQETPVKAGINKAGPYAEYLIDGRKYRVAYGTNGYIVSFYPLKY